ncbi:MAG: FAD-dependent oxidoreductase [Deltaproteobacteria bacterium]|nr:FAD-dependent oxidoreductase [Deltaproteobacteria bacterium]
MERTRYLIVGAGVTGLAFADWLEDDDYWVVEAEDEMGGYCRTVERDGFIWDYSGHFFHFRNPEIEAYLVDRMGDQAILRVNRDSRIWYADRYIDFPFQKNIHQLPESEYAQCLRDLHERPKEKGGNFKGMLYARYGRGIAEKFLIPYNEKLYAVNLAALDPDAMGRFFPHASVEEILRNADAPSVDGYNATFTYPKGGAAQYIDAIAQGVRSDRVALSERVVSIDLNAKVATTNRRQIAYDVLVNSAPLISLLDMCGIDYDSAVLSHNRVQVFNLGFDSKGPTGVHWIYYPQRDISFYRVGFYDNIFDSDHMSLYVEVGVPWDVELSPDERGALKARVLTDLQTCGVLENQTLIASHDVLLDPAYVHITARSIATAANMRELLAAQDVHSIGRYGAWTYCSIEDNIVEARALAEHVGPAKT